MLFNSLEFLLFFPLVALLFHIIPFSGFRFPFLFAASYFFYMWWRPEYIFLILLSTAIDYFAGLWMPKVGTQRGKKMLLTASILTNLGLLGAFKYFTFVLYTLNLFGNWMGFPTLSAQAGWVLPVGISFYTFQSMSYTVDVYRGRLKPERNPLQFALYVAYFPQLVAGPIERAGHLLPQLKNPKPLTSDGLQQGVALILWGLYKKMVIADGLARWVDPVYSRPEQYSGGDYLIAFYAFTWQIYCDFSGYTDVARGAARILGIELSENFQKPYFAFSIQDFWRKWHISLSSWLKDYLYIPLGGSRRGTTRTYYNLLLTMALGGLWHGASWNFVIWGAFHGGLLAVGKWVRDWRGSENPPPTGWRRSLRQIATFHLVCVGWIFFRAADLPAALQILTGVFSLRRPVLPRDWGHGALIIFISTFLFLLMESLAGENPTVDWLRRKNNTWILTPVLFWVLLTLALFSAGTSQQFIYFQF
ncbi:MAG: MBOAT family O-acyltransferase [Nitrospinota bacterium]|nr:MBOAT family O-acyltransferase [Nitrospinota bacterium]